MLTDFSGRFSADALLATNRKNCCSFVGFALLPVFDVDFIRTCDSYLLSLNDGFFTASVHPFPIVNGGMALLVVLDLLLQIVEGLSNACQSLSA